MNSVGIEGVVLRSGAFYGPGTGILDRTMLDQVRHRRVPLIGEANGWWSFASVDDAAAATVNAITRGAAGIYNIVDDEPAPVREWLPALAAMLGAKAPVRVPKWLALIMAGRPVVTMMTEGRAAPMRRQSANSVWQPAHSTWRRGFAEALARQSLV